MQLGLTDAEMMDILHHADHDGDGFLDFRDFATQFATLQDSNADKLAIRRRRRIAAQRKLEKQKAAQLSAISTLDFQVVSVMTDTISIITHVHTRFAGSGPCSISGDFRTVFCWWDW